MKRYDNGELITKDRIEDEVWYSSLYQPFLEFSMGFHLKHNGNKEIKSDVDALYEHNVKCFKEIFKNMLSDADSQRRLLRWCVLHTERMKDFDCNSLERKMKEKAPQSVYIYSNGNVSCFDYSGQQMGRLQSKGWLELWLEWMESQGINPLEIGEIKTIVNGRDSIIKPFRVEDGWNCEINAIID